MPTYPSFEQAEASVPTVRGGVMVRTATNGSSRPRSLSSGPREDLTLVHVALTPAQFDTLKAFYLANRATAFDVVYWGDDGTGDEDVPRSCYFRDPPYSRAPFKTPGGLRYRVQVNLVQAD